MRFLKRTFFFILLSFCFGVDTTFFLLYRGEMSYWRRGFLGGDTFGGLMGNADICAWIEMWFLHLELLITILLYGDIFKS